MILKITWYSHACFLIESETTKLLIDPFLTGNPLAPVAPTEVNPDYILVSHGHGDHVGDTVEIAKRTGATVIANFEIQTWLSGQGVENRHLVGFDVFHGAVLDGPHSPEGVVLVSALSGYLQVSL